MDAEARARLIISAKDDATAVFSQLTQAVKENTDALQDAKNKEQTTKQANDDFKLSLTDVAAGFYLVKNAIGMAKGAYDEIIGKTLEYSDTLRGVSRETGVSLQEAAKIVKVAGDAQVSNDTLTRAFKEMVKDGVQPSVESLAKLADQYNSLSDPVARTQFALEKFGKSGLEMAKVLELGGQGIKEMADEATKAGLVMSDQDVKAAHDYEKSLNDLGDAVDALKIKITAGILPALADWARGEVKEIDTLNLVQYALEKHIVTNQEAADSTDRVKAAVGTQSMTLEELTKRVEQYDKAQASATGEINDAKDAYGLAVPPTINFAAAQAEAARWTGLAGEALDKEKQKILDAKNAQTELAAGLSGQVGQATTDYTKKTTSLNDEIAKTQKELDKYQKMQGQTVTVTTEAKASQLDLTNAQFDAETAALKLADAQKKLNENTNPDKQRQLEGAVIDAQVAVEKAGQNVSKLSDQLGSSKTVTLDYGTKIGELKGHLADLQGQADEAAAQMHKLTNEFIFQQASAGLDAGAALDLARNLGLIDDQTYTTSKALDDLRNKFDKNKDGALDASEAAAGYTSAVSGLAGVIAQLQDKHITVTVDTIQRQIAENGVTASGTSGQVTNPNSNKPKVGFAGGADFIVPPGYSNDSFPFHAQTGERVKVTPANEVGKGGDGGVTVMVTGNQVRSDLDLEMLATKVARKIKERQS